MKTLFGVALSALFLATPVITRAAPADSAVRVVVIHSTPYAHSNGGGQAMPTFEHDRSGGDPLITSTPYTFGTRGANQAPVFDYRGAVPMTAMFNAKGQIVRPFGPPALVNRSGGGR